MRRYAISIFALFVMSFTFIACSHNQPVLIESTATESTLDQATVTETDVGYIDDEVCVYVCGAVINPGVFYIEADSIKKDALDAAGGFCEGAAMDYINLAESVSNGEKIYFPYEDELQAGIAAVASSESDGKVNINIASKDELMTLPGIGANKADAIIKYREEYGPFSSIEDIKSISGIKEGVYNNIKEFIVVN